MPINPRSLLIAEDHALLRMELVEVLSKLCPETILSQAVNGTQVIEHLQKNDCEFILLDIEMPEKNGLQALKELRSMELKSQPKVLIMSTHITHTYVKAAMDLGANGFIPKNVSVRNLSSAITEINNGGKYIHPLVARL